MTSPWIALAGWLGAGLLLAAYALLSTRKLEGDSPVFQALNIVGSIGIAANSAAAGALPSAAVNLIWMAIGVFALLRGLGRRRARPSMP